MRKKDYVVSVKVIKGYNGKELKPEEQYYEYFSYDRYAGSMSSGYPCFDCLNHAERFESVEEAEKTFNNCKKDLELTTSMSKIDLSTIAIRKIVVKTKKMLTW